MKRHLLLVEDNPDDADLSVAALKQHIGDVDIAVVEDGVEALEYLTCTGHYEGRPQTLPQVVLLDLKLPRMDGHEVLQNIRSHPRLKHLPVVILTSSLEEEDLANSYERGANSYVRKPVDFDDFSTVAERLGEYWLELNRPPPTIRWSGT
jgi:two-component system response regulator